MRFHMLNSFRNIALACALSMLAGYVDGIGYLHLGGLFVSFMSGNSTRMAVSLAGGDWPVVGQAFMVIVLFVIGAACGSLIVLGRRSYRQPWVLLAEAMLLVIAGLCHAFGLAIYAIAAIVLAMGLENAAFQVDGGGGLGVTYVTGALVKVGQLIGSALAGGARFAWAPNLLLWAALVLGAVLGALAYHWINLASIWFAAGFAFALCAVAALTEPQ
jgi:uncharacterized membrane protein YoaK (UPF0700 family)